MNSVIAGTPAYFNVYCGQSMSIACPNGYSESNTNNTGELIGIIDVNINYQEWNSLVCDNSNYSNYTCDRYDECWSNDISQAINNGNVCCRGSRGCLYLDSGVTNVETFDVDIENDDSMFICDGYQGCGQSVNVLGSKNDLHCGGINSCYQNNIKIAKDKVSIVELHKHVLIA